MDARDWAGDLKWRIELSLSECREVGIVIDTLLAECDRLKGLVIPCFADPKPELREGYPETANDVLNLLSCYWADVMGVESIPTDSYFAAWEQAARPVIEHLLSRAEGKV